MPSSPVRLRLSRAKGFNLQDLSRATNGLPAVVVARPGRWGNHVDYEVRDDGTRTRVAREPATRIFEHHLTQGWCCFNADDVRRELRGKNLACWCPVDGGSCHADVLLRLANTPTQEPPDAQ